ncbi:hypothetical protein M768_20865 [Cellulosimicrobium cellulans F16]|uniref:Uncharacterized protein n=1 Tax=Cellulosimicrobium cellulans F16 TaxID=1350482 RepID=A0A0M0F775_CELCE|nr:hypothetical protein M768_20865 [Cellulosimicrobium cellulans F16]
MSAGLLGSDVALADRYDLALVDLDGVAYRPAAGSRSSTRRRA